MRTLLATLTALMLFATPVMAGHGEHGYSANDIAVESVDFEQKNFVADPINLRVGPGLKYCLKKTLTDGFSKSVEVIGQFQFWRQILLDGNSYWVHKSLLADQ